MEAGLRIRFIHNGRAGGLVTNINRRIRARGVIDWRIACTTLPGQCTHPLESQRAYTSKRRGVQMGSHASYEYDVSVIIPSVGRPALRRAVDSVLAQEFDGRVEVVVVFDLDGESTTDDVKNLAAGADKVIFTGGGRRGGAARNLGVANSSGEWIAFLDDDDEWAAKKLQLQMAATAVPPRGQRTVIGCRAAQTVSKNGSLRTITGVPGRLIGFDEEIQSYLFRRRRAGSRRASFFASSVLAHRDLCLSVPWDERLKRHQDWDWLVRLGQQPGVNFHQVEQELITIHVGTEGSISAGSDWEASMHWAAAALHWCDPQTRVDFLAAQPLRYAMQSKDRGGVRAVLGEMARARCTPSFGPVLIGIAGLLPRRSLQGLMSIFR